VAISLWRRLRNDRLYFSVPRQRRVAAPAEMT
jgi:hypothetical protein